MPRYELIKGSSKRFWQITRSGLTVTTTYGRIGARGRQTVKTFETPTKARASYKRQIAAKTQKGYVKKGKLREVVLATSPPYYGYSPARMMFGA